MIDNDDVLRQARDSLSGIRMEAPVDAIMARSRARRRHRALSGLSAAGTAGAVVLALGLAGVFSGSHPGAARSHTIRTAAFTLVKNANGTATLTLSEDQVFNPGELQQALAQDGIPALVESGTYCTSSPSPGTLDGVLSVQLPDGTPVVKSAPGNESPVPADAVTVINPSAMPAGTELFFDYLNNNQTLTGGLIYANSYTCTPGGPPAPAGSSHG